MPAGGSGQSGKKSGAAAVRLAQKQQTAVDLRVSGFTLQQIADRLGYAGPQGAQRAITTALKRTLQPATDELRKIEVERFDRIIRELWPLAFGKNTPESTRFKAIDRLLRVSHQRAVLLGLNEPTRFNVTAMVTSAADAMGLTDDERRELDRDVKQFLGEATGFARTR